MSDVGITDDEPEFDAEGLFDDDYLHFYGPLIDERTQAESEFVRRLLGVSPGDEVLDLACGHGRLSNRLAAMGCRVTGSDNSATFLRRARADAAELGVEVTYVDGDMRELPWQERFDAVLNWFTAFGYFSDSGNRRVLSEVHRALRPGGRLVMELNDVVELLPRYRSQVVHEVGDDMMIDHHRLDPLTMRSIVERVVVRGGRVRHVPHAVRMFTAPELRGWLHQAGFTDVAFRGEDGEALGTGHRRMIALATRA
ncbi:class I SAM-dependent methyltransferase [Saccharopolyspora karakumensis]|uniref:Class I SAM-dependent methyltransferase n=1 Tax=Saccharopolyspora karakumensis TaxID=2530386 RepID=A0A4R5C165_9PSEU|nr:class I SAM-dependent methyltransferase [Saccharopolyspora karakumensis]TDD91530.1 class I SAM-dependent methyltransferase [Saccharopolyspora karakumensis]